ncbi:Gfo/Idh/MocA family protein [Planctomicrobium sp. SH664]|uniref:Gfo/Idh/MocA family protein n=1 Tax=Planctomicrobium sp. SH664 TaxID=3448125 RepID=UPI003F5B956E
MSAPQSHQTDLNRRQFLGNSARNAAGAAAGVLSLGAAASGTIGPNDKLQIGLIGAGEQGRELAQQLAAFPDVVLQSICDVDAKALALLQHELYLQTGERPVALTAHEQLLDRAGIDAVVVATPDHWHARMAIDACRAGKDLYLEQPVAHTIREGEAILQVARQTGRIVQTGLPQRSGAHFQSAVALLQQGELGRVHLAKAWATHRRRPIGRASQTAPPLGVDYQRWLGPAPDHPFQANRFHHNWPWFWDYGSGELGLWGVQLLDVVRWGLNLDLPTRVAAYGGVRSFGDDRQTPDTLQVHFEFPDVDVTWEHRQWSGRGIEGRTAGVAFYGEAGTLIVDRSGWKVYDGRPGLYGDASDIRQSHLRDWINCLRTRRAPQADLSIGEASMAMCHLGNIAYRLGRQVEFDPATRSFGDDAAANTWLRSETRSPWQLPEGIGTAELAKMPRDV